MLVKSFLPEVAEDVGVCNRKQYHREKLIEKEEEGESGGALVRAPHLLCEDELARGVQDERVHHGVERVHHARALDGVVGADEVLVDGLEPPDVVVGAWLHPTSWRRLAMVSTVAVLLMPTS
jgi:hypothetical protein